MKTNALLFLSIICQLSVFGQPQQKTERVFLNELNNILRHTPEQCFGYEGAMTIDSAFALHSGILSSTVRYGSGSSAVRVRMAVAMENIVSVGYDLYLILECANDTITVYESTAGNELLTKIYKNNLFHVGIPSEDGYAQKEKLQKLLANVLKFYTR